MKPKNRIMKHTNYEIKTFYFLLITYNFLTIFAATFGLTSGENREC
ncbi:MAG: hypothetical protein ACI902_000420 [Psychroserpens sp.]|jgi:hypothetical protein